MPFWRKGDEGPVALRITAAGLAALQAGDAGASKRTIMRAHPGARGNKKRVGARPKQATKPARPHREATQATKPARPHREATSGGPSKQDRVIALLRRNQARSFRSS
jgi:hypothetical protein